MGVKADVKAGVTGTTRKLSLAVLISGRGSNMTALEKACRAPDFPAAIGAVLSDNPAAPGLSYAREQGIPAVAVDPRVHAGKPAFEAALQEALVPFAPDIICLAGFMRILSGAFIEKWDGRIVNIHPSLLPAYRGLDTHARVLADGGAEAGCSVHYVTAGVDEGPVILQRRVSVLPHDTAESLAARVLAEEHLAYPEAIRLIAPRFLRAPAALP